jgi:Fe2+ or Zn2+ uptake regulation protein
MGMMMGVDDLTHTGQQRLRAADKRITPQRRLILDILAEADGHLDAGEIYQRGRRQDPRLSLSTVYRTLTALKETGAVRELHLDEEHHHYELETEDQHSHLVCTRCGRVVEIDSAPFAGVAAPAAQTYGFELSAVQVELTGICADCRREAAG